MKLILSVLALSLVLSTSARADWELTGFPCEQVRTVAVHPIHPNIVFAAGEHTWRSMNHGATWEEISYYPANQIYIDPANPTHVYLAWGLGSWSDGLYRSTELGEPWTFEVLHWLPHTSSVVVPEFWPDLIVMGATDELGTGGIYVSFDDGATWGSMNEGLDDLNVLCLDVSPLSDPFYVFYAGTETGIFVRDWDLYLWERTSLPMPAHCIRAYDPDAPDYATVGWGSYSDGIYVSTDQGYTWDVSHWFVFPTAVHVVPMHEDHVFAGDSGYGIVFTPDAGAHWFDLNRGLDDLVIHCFGQSEADPSRIYAGTEEGLYVHSFPPPRCGDANDDGVITTADGYFILNYFASGPEPVYCWTANVNGDGVLSAADGFMLMNYFGAGPPPFCAYCDFPGPLKELR
jgi:hypothetical protein